MTDAAYIREDAIEPEFRDYVALLKPRVMSLVIFTAVVGLAAAPAPVHPVIAFASILCIAIGAGASGALNMWWDADIDARMTRTRGRPVPSGKIRADEALAVGVALSVLSVMMLGLFANPFAAALLAFTIFFYAVVYTMWLKRSTPQNIVIGGAAGAFPPMIGWAVATGGVSLEASLMFMWTPPHFWALALFRNEDYKRVGIPMMPVAAGPRATRNQILAYSALLAVVAIAPAFTMIGGWLYLVVAATLNLRFLHLAWQVFRRDEATAEADRHRTEKKLFGVSIVYLFAHFAALLGEALIRAATGAEAPLALF